LAEELYIPPEAIEPKIFATSPDAALVAEIKEFIAKDGRPYLWRGHTHSRPQKGATIQYVGKFTLPARCCGEKNRARWAPCPCCHLRHPKYFKDGMIAYFPDEKVIRILGPQCFRRLNPEGHDFAYGEFEKAEKKRKQVSYLNSHLGHVPDVISTIDINMPIVTAVESARVVLRDQIDKILHTNMWSHVRDGILTVRVRKTRTTRHRDGTTSTREVDDFETYGPLPGHIMLKRSGSLALRLRQARSKLELINRGRNTAFAVKQMDEAERGYIADSLRRCLDTLTDVYEQTAEVRTFLSPVSISTLRGWGKHEGCPIKIHIDRQGHDLLVGRDEHQHQRFTLDHAFDGIIRQLPEFARRRATR
jgi:hypothetical protein